MHVFEVWENLQTPGMYCSNCARFNIIWTAFDHDIGRLNLGLFCNLKNFDLIEPAAVFYIW